MTSLFAESEYDLPNVSTTTPVATFVSLNSNDLASVLWYTKRFGLFKDSCKKEVSEELRVAAVGSIVNVNSEKPMRLPLLKPGMLANPSFVKACFT